MRDLVGKRKWFFAFSGAILIPGLIAILLGPLTGGAAGLKFSIDFTGGTRWEIQFKNTAVTPSQVKTVLAAEGYGDSTVATSSDSFLVIRTKPLGLETPPPTPVPSVSPQPSASEAASASPEASASASTAPTASGSAAPSASAAVSGTPVPSTTGGGSPVPSGSAAPSSSPAASGSPSPSASPAPSGSPAPSANPSPSGAAIVAPTPAPTATPGPVSRDGSIGKLATALEAALGPIAAQRSVSSVGPIVSSELTQQAMLLVLIGSIGIVLWMTYRFRDFRFGLTALVALLHDVIVVVGIFALLGTFFGVEIDGLFVTAMLTIIGFSVHDTIVVYDRIRENRSRFAGEPFNDIVNHSILQTLGRSINTSVVVIFTLTALLLFGGTAIQTFILALLIGITSGTYSSIFNAAPLLTLWEERDQRRRASAGRPVRRAAT